MSVASSASPTSIEMADGGPQVAALEVEPVRRRELPGVAERRRLAASEGVEVAGVRVAHRALLAALGEQLGRILAHRREHREHRLAVDVRLRHQRAVDERAERVDGTLLPDPPRADRLDRLEGEPRREDPEIRQQAPLVLVEQPRRPLDRRAQRPLPLGQVAARVDQQPQPAVEPLQDAGRRQEPHARRGQLDRERQPVQRLADRDDGRGVRRREREVGLDGPGAFDEQLDRGRYRRAR